MTIEAMKQALDALEEACEIVGAAWAWRDEKGRASILALRKAIEEAEVKEWVGLTNEEYVEATDAASVLYRATFGPAWDNMHKGKREFHWHLFEAIEAKLKEKNT